VKTFIFYLKFNYLYLVGWERTPAATSMKPRFNFTIMAFSSNLFLAFEDGDIRINSQEYQDQVYEKS
jgi:hypothetical protein